MKWLSNKNTLCEYIHSNAYLELSAIDIISDLIIIFTEDKSIKIELLKKSIFELAWQLQDEARHAEIMSSILEKYGKNIGEYTASISTWNIYKMYNDLPSKIAAQHVIHEAMGLDASYLNVTVFERLQNLELKNAYYHISIDELNHVKSGYNILKLFKNSDVDDFCLKIQKEIEKKYPIPHKIPVSRNLRTMCGFSQSYIDIQQSLNGSFNNDFI